MHSKLKVTLCRNNINFHLLLEGKSLKNYFQINYAFSDDFCQLVLFSLLNSEVMIIWLSWYSIIFGYGNTFE